jgi:serine/threonine protein kinase
MAYRRGVEVVPGFRLVQFLGRGGFGDVWKATAPGGTEVALKIISLENKGGFKEFRAIRMVKGIRYPHLVPLYSFWLKDALGNLFDDGAEDDSVTVRAKAAELIIAMGLGDKNLLDRLKECQEQGLPGIPSAELLDYMQDAAKAIDFLNQPIHDLGSGKPVSIQHCDIKPQNIMMVGNSAQVCDFGLARVLGDPRVTQSGGGMSFPYTPPELFTETKPSHSSDQYALAISYVELRTGSLPYENTTQAGIMWSAVQGKLDLSKLLPAEQPIIRRATALDPKQRYPTTLEMVRELRRVNQGSISTPSGKGSKIPEDLQAGIEIVSGYKLVRPLGRGGYGSVWEALAPGGKAVALKIIRNLDKGPGKQEFKALELIKGVDHNHLLDLQAFWLLDAQGEVIPDEVRQQPNPPRASTLVIATKLANKNLLQRLHECQQAGLVGIPPDELLAYMRQAALAIDHLNECQHRVDDHNVSIQHRDIKPENILLVRDIVKVGDFGLARVLEGTSAAIHGDSTGYTPHYAAPELFGNRVSRWTDQYALALTYYKLRTGQMPFDANGALFDVMMTHVEGRLDLSLLPETEREVIKRATSVEPEQRYSTCMELVMELSRALSADFPQELGAQPPYVPRPSDSFPPTTPVITPRLSDRHAPTQPHPVQGDNLATAASEVKLSSVVMQPTDPDETQAPAPPMPATPVATVTPEVSFAAPQEQYKSARPSMPLPPAPVNAWKPKQTSVGVNVRAEASKKAKALAIITTVAVVGGVAAGGIWAWNKFRSRESSSVASNTTKTTSPATSPGTTGTAGGRPTGNGKTAVATKRETSPDERITKALREGDQYLAANNGEGAIESYQYALDAILQYDRRQYKRAAETGLVRAWGLLKEWGRIKEKLPFLALSDSSDPRDKAFIWAWDALVQEGLKPGSPGAMVPLLTRLKQPADLSSTLDEWERKVLQGLVPRVIDGVKSTAKGVIKELPGTFAKLDDALEALGKLTLWDANQAKAVDDLRRQAGEGLRRAASGSRNVFSIDRPFDLPFKDLRSARNAYDWLKKAKDLSAAVPEEILKEMGLAAWQLERNGEAAELLRDYVPDTSPEAVLYLLAQAEVLPDDEYAQLKRAFTAYEEIWNRVHRSTKLSAKEDVLGRVLHPAIKKGVKLLRYEKSTDTVKPQLANLYAAKAELIENDMKVHVADWPDGLEDILAAYKQAVGLVPKHAKANRYLQDHYFKISQASYLSAREASASEAASRLLKAMEEASEASKYDGPGSDDSLLAKGLALEDLAWLGHTRGSFEDAANLMTEAMAKTKNKGKYQFYRGRCYYKAAMRQQKRDLMAKAFEDLKVAISQNLAPDLKMAASFWFALTCYFKNDKGEYALSNQYLTDARSWGEGRKGFDKSFAFDALEALEWLAEIVATRAEEKPNAHLEAATSLCETLVRFARREKNDRAWFLAANRLRWIGERYELTKEPDLVAAFNVYTRGLPENIDETKIAELHVLNARTLLCTKDTYRNNPATKKRDLESLKKEADLALELALKSDHPWNTSLYKREAYASAARVYSLVGDKKKAISLLEQGLELPKPRYENEVPLFDNLEKPMRAWLKEWKNE